MVDLFTKDTQPSHQWVRAEIARLAEFWKLIFERLAAKRESVPLVLLGHHYPSFLALISNVPLRFEKSAYTALIVWLLGLLGRFAAHKDLGHMLQRIVILVSFLLVISVFFLVWVP